MTKRLDKPTARAILQDASVERGADFHALTTWAVLALETAADERGYRKPANANGSRVRYWHAYLQRAAA